MVDSSGSSPARTISVKLLSGADLPWWPGAYLGLHLPYGPWSISCPGLCTIIDGTSRLFLTTLLKGKRSSPIFFRKLQPCFAGFFRKKSYKTEAEPVWPMDSASLFQEAVASRNVRSRLKWMTCGHSFSPCLFYKYKISRWPISIFQADIY